MNPLRPWTGASWRPLPYPVLPPESGRRAAHSPSALPAGPQPVFREVSSLVAGPRVAMSAAARKRLAAMPPSRRRMFEDLRTEYDGRKVRFPTSQRQASVSRALDDLLEGGLLDLEDTRGVDLLANMHALRVQPVAAGIHRRTLTAQAIVEVASPAATMAQGNHGTCAAASIQYLLARRNPSELVRVAAGLLSPAGRVALADGRVARRVDDSVPEDHSGRSALDRIMQAAFMDAAADGSTAGRYSNRRDGFVLSIPPALASSRGLLSPFGQSGDDLVVQSGLRPEQTLRLAEAALGVPYQEIYREGWGSPRRALSRMDGLLRGGAEPLPVSIKWEGGSHRVVVTEIRNGRVYFRNPWGERQKGDREGSLSGVDHRIGEGGLESIPANDFAARMRSVMAPTHLLQGGPRA